MPYYKGFKKDLTCKGFQYKEGVWQHVSDKASLCNEGVHACEAPLDVLKYYPPADSQYREVELSGVSSERLEDSKVVATDIRVGAELGILGLVKAHIEYVKSKTTFEHTDPKQATAGDSGAATAGYRGAATAGSYGAATAGSYGAATAGDSGAATAGSYGAATAGSYGAATVGYRGAATAGSYGAATSRGKSRTGKDGLCVARGNGVMVCGGLGSLLVIAEESDENYSIVSWRAVVVDGETIKPDTWYELKDGELVEVDDK